MPQPTWAQLQDYESQFDAALTQILAPLAAAPYNFTLYPQQVVTTLAAPRCEFQIVIGDPAGPSGEIQVLPSGRLKSFNFRLRYLFVYDRMKLAASAQGFRGAFREIMAPGQDAFSETVLPWLEISALNEITARRGYLAGAEKDKALDTWESIWDGIAALRDSAIPA